MSAAATLAGRVRRADSLHVFLWLAGVGLLLQGIASLVALRWGQGGNHATHGALNADARHPWVHIIYGAIVVAALLTQRPRRELALLTLAFGVFYLLFALLGLLANAPLGILLGPGENVFHLVVGGVSLAVGLQAFKERRERTS